MADFGIGEALALASLAATAVGTAASISQAQASQEAAARAAAQNQDIANQNAQRQATAINRNVGQEERTAITAKSDEMARAEKQLGTLRVMAGEMGSSGSTFNALVQQEGYTEGTDLSRTDQTYDTQFRAGEFAKQGVSLDYKSTSQNIGNQLQSQTMAASNAITGSVISGVGSSMSIGSSYYRTAKLDSLVNKPTANANTAAVK